MNFLIMLLQEVGQEGFLLESLGQGEDGIGNSFSPAMSFPRQKNAKQSNEWQFLKSVQLTLPESWQMEHCRGHMAREFPQFHPNFIFFLKILAAGVAAAAALGEQECWTRADSVIGSFTMKRVCPWPWRAHTQQGTGEEGPAPSSTRGYRFSVDLFKKAAWYREKDISGSEF